MTGLQVHRTPLPRQIADLILAELIQSGAAPGSPLPAEGKLAERFEVSRPMVREALKHLAGRGFVEVLNGRGTLVKPLDDGLLTAYFVHAVAIERVPFRELMEARKPVEVQSARLAAQRRTPEQLAGLRDIIRAMQRAIGNAEVYVNLDQNLHGLIADASGNRVIADVIRAIRGALNETTHNTLYRRRNRQQLERVHQLHEIIVHEIGAQNAEAAARAMDMHFSEALQFLVERQALVRR